MHNMASYDLMETMRNTNQFMGAAVKAWASYPTLSAVPNPAIDWLAAWGEVTERAFERMVVKPDWGIHSITCADGRDHLVTIEKVIERPFGDLIRFNVQNRAESKRKVLVVAPMSGHYATLLRSTVKSLIIDCEVYVTDWHNARDIPVSAGKFDVEDYTMYLVDFMTEMGPDTQPRSMTLIGGPIDPDAAATDVTDFGRRVTMGQLEQAMIQRVGYKYAGV